MSRVLFSAWFRIQGMIKKCPANYSASGSEFSVGFKRRSPYYSVSGSAFSVWFEMASLLFSIWFRIQRMIKKCPAYYSAPGSGFNVRFKNDQRNIQGLVQDSVYELKMSGVLFSVWFRVQRTIKKWPAYYSWSGSGFRVWLKKMTNVLFSIWFRIQRTIQKCPASYSASGSGFSVQLKNEQIIIQRLVQDSAYYSKWPAFYSASGSGFSVRLKN